MFSNNSTVTNAVQVTAAKETNAYKNTTLQRTIYMLQLPGENKMVVDIFNVNSTDQHQYDLPFQYDGQFINTTFKYIPSIKTQEPLSKKNGYEYLWKEAEASVRDTTVQFTFLNHTTYYTISSMIEGAASLLFTRIGANDPDFNLRREPAYIIRKNGTNQSFVNVIEIHGKFNPVTELSSNAYPSVKKIRLLQNDTDFSIVEILINDKKLVIAQCNKDFTNTKHTVRGITWNGPYVVLYDEKILN